MGLLYFPAVLLDAAERSCQTVLKLAAGSTQEGTRPRCSSHVARIKRPAFPFQDACDAASKNDPDDAQDLGVDVRAPQRISQYSDPDDWRDPVNEPPSASCAHTEMHDHADVQQNVGGERAEGH